jgi:hypothetical protein
MRLTVLYKRRRGFQYDLDWRDAFLASTDVQATSLAVGSIHPGLVARLLRAETVVLLHSVDPSYPGTRSRLLTAALRHSRARTVYFPRNEFKNFAAKRRFIRAARVRLVASQLAEPTARYLYGDLAPLITLHHATNPEIYSARTPWSERRVILGGRSVVYPRTLLDSDRNDLRGVIEQIRARRPGWRVDYSDRPEDRFDRLGWARFLDSCRFTIASEAGAPFVDRTDGVQEEAARLLRAEPAIEPSELRSRLAPRLAGLPSGKHITSRHFEAMGCGTCQILLRGDYCGVLQPDVHYLPLEPDGSNLEAVIRKMEDPAYVSGLIERSYTLVRSGHTHHHRLGQLISALRDL